MRYDVVSGVDGETILKSFNTLIEAEDYINNIFDLWYSIGNSIPLIFEEELVN